MNSLYQHQKDFLENRVDKTALVWSCGTGKSRTAIEWSNSDGGNVLIICPKSLKANWQREWDMYSHGTAVRYRIMSKEEFRRDHASLNRYEQMIVDEVHAGFLTPHFKSAMSKSLRYYLKVHSIPRVLLLSATVYTSSPWNIYNLAFLIGVKLDWQKFNQMFFTQVRMGNRLIPVPKKGSEEKLARITRSIASVVDIHEVMDVPLQNNLEPEYFALTNEQTRAIEDNYDPMPIVRYTWQHEIENGVLIGHEFMEGKTYLCDKNERIEALCEENKKIAIVCRYNAQIDVLEKLLKEYKPFVIRGDVKDRDSICRQAEAADKAVVLIQADCAEGYELPSFPVCVFASMSYSYVKWEQICGRFLRMNKPSRTTFIYLLSEGDSIDQGVYDAVKRKEDFSISLYRR